MTRLLRAIVLVLAFAGGVPRGRASIQNVLDLYDRGQYSAAQAQLAQLGGVDAALDEFNRVARPWIRAVPPSAQGRRTLIAAAVALEFAHAGVDEEDQSIVNRARFIAQGCTIVRAAHTPLQEAERWWYLASVAGLEELGAWPALSGSVVDSFASKRVAEIDGGGGHLSHALAAFPDEARFELARVEAREADTMISGNSRHWSFEEDAVTAERLAELRYPPQAPRSSPALDSAPPAEQFAYSRRMAAAELKRISMLPDIERQYSALLERPELRAEVMLRLGYLELRVQDWGAGQQKVQSVANLTGDAFLLYFSHLFSAWGFEQQKQTEEAIGAYGRALTLSPRAWSASVLLSVQLFLRNASGDRERAASILRDAERADPRRDPWTLYRRGDARLWESEMAHLREALR
jgi:tetratricopeptide (TPR) repeat protein